MTRSRKVTAYVSVEIELVVRGSYTPEDPGQCYGPPENCYPPEAAEFSIERVHVMGADGRKVEVLDVVRDWLTERIDGDKLLASASAEAAREVQDE